MSDVLFLGDGKKADDLSPAIVPVWTIDFEDEDQLKAWDKRTAESLHEKNRNRTSRTLDHRMRYKGVYASTEPVIGGAMLLGQQKKQQFTKVVANHSQDLVEQKVATLLKYQPTFEVSPDSLETKDKQDSIAVKRLLDSIDYWTGIKKEYHKILRYSILDGQAWIHPYWNEDIGPNKGRKVKSIPIERQDGTTWNAEVAIKQGDIAFKIVPDHELYLFPAESEEEIPAIMWERVLPTDELKAAYPDKAEFIIESRGAKTWNWHELEENIRPNHTVVRYYWYRSRSPLEKGLFFSLTNEVVLDEPQDNPIPRDQLETTPLGNLPFARLTDVDVEGEVDGYPSFAFITQLQHIYDKYVTLCHKNIFMFCHPKWVFQQNTCDEARFSNGSLLLPHKGSVPPQLQVSNALTQDILKFGELILGTMEKVMRVSSVSRGTPPPGTRAAASLYFYDEQEQTANSVFRKKVEDFVVRLQMLKLAIISDKYDGERLVWILGKNDEWLARRIETSTLKKRYTVRIKSSSNLPDSKFARIQALLDLAQTFPNIVTQEHVVEMMDFGQNEAFMDYARKSVMAAEQENEMLMAGEPIEAPIPSELQIEHWKTHNTLAQDPSFKQQDKKIRESIEEHIGGHELIMLQLGENNPSYKAQLAQIPQFPLFAPLPPPIPGMMPTPMGEAPAGAGGPPGQPGRPPVGPAKDLPQSLTGGDIQQNGTPSQPMNMNIQLAPGAPSRMMQGPSGGPSAGAN